ncbi:MAG: hypothetical protein A2X82_01125 [Geobacteraceae bacterium GWC2_55_20]|nr:MAG: hypothetical protein A2X82_01125 [Geobacteraceae bacterium GWC2_55_20]OGU25689.1 MAG: hypothetical protein A2X85_14080 [Geobacteraceae bacterium GWF2_54_21]HCE68610.1 hypothetical protein [Geobacter sp.]
MNRPQKFLQRLDYRWLAVVAAALALAFGGGYVSGKRSWHVHGSFHDMIVNNPRELSALITPRDKRIRTLAASLKSYENAHLYVRDRIADDPSIPALPAGDIIDEGRASCLGKAIVLCSLYRALGKPASDVRIVIGEADLPTGGFDHAWIELEYDGQCLQQDTTNILGHFAFAQFKGTNYVETFIRDEEFVVNDKSFALVSQLNRLKGTGHPRF